MLIRADLREMASKRSFAIVLVLLMLTAASCGGQEPRLLDGPGSYSLDWMGYGDQTLKLNRTRDTNASVRYRLPPGAHQGGSTWYRIRLHYRVKVSPQSGPGKIYLSAQTNHMWLMASIIFSIRRAGDRRLEVRSDSLGLIEGSVIVTAKKLAWQDMFSNYLLLDGVQPGENTLTFSLRQTERAKVESATIYADSALVVDGRGPAHLELTPSIADREIHVGERFRIGYTIENRRRGPVAAGGVVTIRTEPGLEPVGPTRRELDRIGGHGKATGSFELLAREPGRHRIQLQASTWGGSPLVNLAADVQP